MSCCQGTQNFWQRPWSRKKELKKLSLKGALIHTTTVHKSTTKNERQHIPYCNMMGEMVVENKSYLIAWQEHALTALLSSQHRTQNCDLVLHPFDNDGIRLKSIWFLFTMSSTVWKGAIVDRQQLHSTRLFTPPLSTADIFVDVFDPRNDFESLHS